MKPYGVSEVGTLGCKRPKGPQKTLRAQNRKKDKITLPLPSLSATLDNIPNWI